MITLCIILLPNDRVHAIPADSGKLTNSTPVTDEVIELDVAPILTIVSPDCNFVFKVFF